MIKGSCLCGQVTYEYQGEISELAICHCQQCKRAQGTAFVTNAPIDTTKMKWLSGQHQFKSYYSSPNKKRVFCQNCGSPLFSQLDNMPQVIRLRVGTITHGKIPAPNYQIYCESASKWLELEGKPQYLQNVIKEDVPELE
jgi:hypothetical protein